MEFCLFILTVIVAGALCLSAIRSLVKALPAKPGKRRSAESPKGWIVWAREAVPYAFALVLAILYLPHANQFWGCAGSSVDHAIGSGGGKFYRLIEVFAVARFFRAAIPGTLVLFGWTVVAAVSREYPATALYRYAGRFPHRRAWFLAATWSGYLLAEILNTGDAGTVARDVFLNLALVPAGMYFLAGFQYLVVILRKRRMPWAAAAGMVTLPVVVAGPFFLIPLIVIAGVGVSDIWMCYLPGKRRING